MDKNKTIQDENKVVLDNIHNYYVTDLFELIFAAKNPVNLTPSRSCLVLLRLWPLTECLKSEQCKLKLMCQLQVSSEV